MKRCIASVSRGKDGLAMLHGPIERGMPLDEVVFYDTGMEFDAICAERDRMLPLMRENEEKGTLRDLRDGYQGLIQNWSEICENYDIYQ